MWCYNQSCTTLCKYIANSTVLHILSKRLILLRVLWHLFRNSTTYLRNGTPRMTSFSYIDFHPLWVDNLTICAILGTRLFSSYRIFMMILDWGCFTPHQRFSTAEGWCSKHTKSYHQYNIQQQNSLKYCIFSRHLRRRLVAFIPPPMSLRRLGEFRSKTPKTSSVMEGSFETPVIW